MLIGGIIKIYFGMNWAMLLAFYAIHLKPKAIVPMRILIHLPNVVQGRVIMTVAHRINLVVATGVLKATI